MSTIHRIPGRSGDDSTADVLFLHGLGGDAFGTWRHGKDETTSWPHWMGKEFPDVGVWSLGYAASPTKRLRGLRQLFGASRDAGRSMALPDRAGQVLDRMVQRDFGERPILLICHSLGGLLAKQILRMACDSTEPPKKAIFSNTRAVLFLATPHAGAALAEKAQAFRAICGPTASMEDLQAHDAHLRELLNWYRNHSTPKIQTVTYFETHDLLGFRIVNETSAHPGVGRDPVGLGENHLSIAKPRQPHAQVCDAARALLVAVKLPEIDDSSLRSDSTEVETDLWPKTVAAFELLREDAQIQVVKAIGFHDCTDKVMQHVRLKEFFQCHSTAETHNLHDVSVALAIIGGNIVETDDAQTQSALMSIQDSLMSLLVPPSDNSDVAESWDHSKGVIVVGKPIGAELVSASEDQRPTRFKFDPETEEIVGEGMFHYLDFTISDGPIGDPDPYETMCRVLRDLADRVSATVYEEDFGDEQDVHKRIEFWADELLLGIKIDCVLKKCRCYCVVNAGDSDQGRRFIDFLGKVSPGLDDVGFFQIDRHSKTKQAETIATQIIRDRLTRGNLN